MPLDMRDIAGNSFWHGLPLNADPPTAYCKTYWPSRVCTCGATVLTWATRSVPTAPGEGVSYVGASVFVHAQQPQDGSGPLCETAAPAECCACGTYRIVWETV
jgi:hypothetical protein